MHALVNSVLSSLATSVVGGSVVTYHKMIRRFERLTSLVEVRDALPAWLSDDDELAHLSAEELSGIATSKTASSSRASVAVMVVVSAWVAGMIAWAFYAPPQYAVWEWPLIVLGVGAAVAVCVIERRTRAKLVHQHRRRVGLVDASMAR